MRQQPEVSQSRRLYTYLLLGLSLFWECLLLLALSKELSLLGRLGGLGLDEVGVVDGLWDGDTSDIDLGGSGDDVGLADTTKVDTVDSAVRPINY
jgi:hypothetical protein